MTRPPQLDADRAQRAERDAKIFKLKVAGLTERQISAEVGLSQPRVHEIITEQIGQRVGPPAAEYVALREAELHELWSKAYRLALTAEDPADKLKAIETARRVNESRRKLRGADAPEALRIALDKRTDQDAELIAHVLLQVVPTLAKAAGVDLGREQQLSQYGLELAAWHLLAADGAAPGPEPECPPARLALPPGSGPERPSAGRSPHTGPTAPPPYERDAAEDVLATLADFEGEFGPLDEEGAA